MKISDTALRNTDVAGVRALAGVAVGVATGRR